MKYIELSSHSPEDTRRLGEQMALLLGGGDVVALTGELGAGKTVLVQGLAKGLGVKDQVHSPTFILANEYRTGRVPLCHIDAYRVQDAAEAQGIGLDDYVNGDGVTVIEWAERVRAALPVDHIWVELLHRDETTWVVRIRADGARYQAIIERLARQWD